MSDRVNYATEERYGSVSVCTPAGRMVVLTVMRDEEGDFEHWFSPVVAIRSRVVRKYSKSYLGDEAPPGYGTERQLVSDGWVLMREEEKTEALFVDPSYGILGHQDSLARSSNTELSVHVCPWPPEEDESRLVGAIHDAAGRIARYARLRKPAADTPANN
jgi:hypothetical protein